jgi:psiF repeat
MGGGRAAVYSRRMTIGRHSGLGAVCLLLVGLAFAAETQSPVPSARPAQTSAPESVALNDEAAEKHAKRTACLKNAKAKKLVGAQRGAFVKTCLEQSAAS